MGLKYFRGRRIDYSETRDNHELKIELTNKEKQLEEYETLFLVKKVQRKRNNLLPYPKNEFF